MNASLRDVVATALVRLGKEFRANELAYLALTSKVELPLRDRLAFLLHNELGPRGLIVSREWKRVDIAILDCSGFPVLLIELKAMITANAVQAGGPRKWIDRVAQDFNKRGKIHADHQEVETIAILLATHHFETMQNDALQSTIKYWQKSNAQLAIYGGKAEELALVADQNTSDMLTRDNTGLSVYSRGRMMGGAAFGYRSDILWWLITRSVETGSTCFGTNIVPPSTG